MEFTVEWLQVRMLKFECVWNGMVKHSSSYENKLDE